MKLLACKPDAAASFAASHGLAQGLGKVLADVAGLLFLSLWRLPYLILPAQPKR